jgi:hypothetical protein
MNLRFFFYLDPKENFPKKFTEFLDREIKMRNKKKKKKKKGFLEKINGRDQQRYNTTFIPIFNILQNYIFVQKNYMSFFRSWMMKMSHVRLTKLFELRKFEKNLTVDATVRFMAVRKI